MSESLDTKTSWTVLGEEDKFPDFEFSNVPDLSIIFVDFDKLTLDNLTFPVQVEVHFWIPTVLRMKKFCLTFRSENIF